MDDADDDGDHADSPPAPPSPIPPQQGSTVALGPTDVYYPADGEQMSYLMPNVDCDWCVYEKRPCCGWGCPDTKGLWCHGCGGRTRRMCAVHNIRSDGAIVGEFLLFARLSST